MPDADGDADAAGGIDGNTVGSADTMKHELAVLLGDVSLSLYAAYSRSLTFIGESEHVVLVVVHVEHRRSDEHTVALECHLRLCQQLYVGGGAVGLVKDQGLRTGSACRQEKEQAEQEKSSFSLLMHG